MCVTQAPRYGGASAAMSVGKYIPDKFNEEKLQGDPEHVWFHFGCLQGQTVLESRWEGSLLEN